MNSLSRARAHASKGTGPDNESTAIHMEGNGEYGSWTYAFLSAVHCKSYRTTELGR